MDLFCGTLIRTLEQGILVECQICCSLHFLIVIMAVFARETSVERSALYFASTHSLSSHQVHGCLSNENLSTYHPPLDRVNP